MARVPDFRLDALAEMSSSRNVVPATVQFVDIGGLVEGASKGEGLGNRFLAHIREADAVVYVLRAFEDPDVPGEADPLEHLRIVELELTLADLETVESQIERRRKASRADKSLVDEVAALDAAHVALAAGTPLYRTDIPAEQRALLRSHFLLTNRPVLAVVNVDEQQLTDLENVIAPVKAELGGRAEVIGMCIQLEAEAAPRCSRHWGSATERCHGSSTRPTTCSGCARSSRQETRSRGRGRSAPGGRRRSARA
jgi:ribosome-binding ATPase YchF (GTP1/OBG family)